LWQRAVRSGWPPQMPQREPTLNLTSMSNDKSIDRVRQAFTT
jgi:hypothetical protein